MAVREDEDVAEAMGINLVQTKLLAFACGAAFSGISGTVRYNLGEVPFRHAPPAADFQAYAGCEG